MSAEKNGAASFRFAAKSVGANMIMAALAALGSVSPVVARNGVADGVAIDKLPPNRELAWSVHGRIEF